MADTQSNRAYRKYNVRAATECVLKNCAKYGISGPLDFLSLVMLGKDPRFDNPLYTFLRRLMQRKGDVAEIRLTEREVIVIRDLLECPESRFDYVPLQASIDAAKEINKYTLPRQRTVETIETATVVGAPDKVTKKQIHEVLQAFEDEY